MGIFDSSGTTTTKAYDLPTDYDSGLKDVLGDAKGIYEAKKDTGYIDYPGPRIADYTDEEKAAMTGISGLVGAGASYFDPAKELVQGLGDQFTADTANTYMNPYQQSVVDIEKRKAREDYDQTMQGLGAKAVGAGAFGGSRQAILEGEATSDLSQRLGDLQAIGTKQAFEDARKAFEAQKTREKGAASALTNLGTIAPNQSLKELTGLAGVGEADRDMTQAKYDMAFKDFEDRKDFASDNLKDYAGYLYGYPTEGYKTGDTYHKPSAFEKISAVGDFATKTAPFFGFNGGGHIAFRSHGGLSGMYPEEIDQYSPVPEQKAVPEPTTKENVQSSLLDIMKNSLSGMSTDLNKLQAMRTKLLEAKTKEALKANTPMAKLGDFFGGVARGYDPSRPSNMVSSISAGTEAMGDVQDPEAIKAALEQEVIKGNISIAEARMKLANLGLKTAVTMDKLNTDPFKFEAPSYAEVGSILNGRIRNDKGETIPKSLPEYNIIKGNIYEQAKKQARLIALELNIKDEAKFKQLVITEAMKIADGGKSNLPGSVTSNQNKNNTDAASDIISKISKFRRD